MEGKLDMFIGNYFVFIVDMYLFLLFGDCFNFYFCVVKFVICFFENVGVNRIYYIFFLKND